MFCLSLFILTPFPLSSLKMVLKLIFFSSSSSSSLSLLLLVSLGLQFCYYSLWSPEEERGEGRPCCWLCTVQMLFQLIHQCQLQPSVERQDAGEREVMKALWWTCWITGNPNPPWSFSLRYHEICSTIISAAITFSWDVTWNKAALRGQKKSCLATRIVLNWVCYHCKVLRWFCMWLHWKLSNARPNCYLNPIFWMISTNHIWRNPIWFKL